MSKHFLNRKILKFIIPFLVITTGAFVNHKKPVATAAWSGTQTSTAGNYYSSVGSETGSALQAKLKTIISSPKPSTNYGWDRFKAADEAEGQSNSVILIYSRVVNPKSNTGGNATNWNREHTYPQSKIGSPATEDNHHIFADDNKTNGARGNKLFGEVSETSSNQVNDMYGNKTNNYTAGNYFMPNPEARGEVARATMYLTTLYGYSVTGNFQTVDLMLKWHLENPVTNRDIYRNNTVHSLQKNRNPFVDHPEYACAIWGGTNSATQNLCNTAGAVAVESVTLNPTSQTINLQDTTTLQINATVLPSNAANKNLTWTSSNASIATVSSSGLVSAKAVGTTTITATSVSDSTKKATATISVVSNDVPVASVSLNKTSSTLGVGGSETLSATVLPANATNKDLNWTSSNTSVATVTSSGKISALAVGTTTITATSVSDSTKKATATITVISNEVAVTGVFLNKTTSSLMVGNTEELSATVFPVNATNKDLNWTSSNESVATVRQNGVVEGVGNGTAVISATSASNPAIKGQVTFTVYGGEVKVESLTLNKSEATLKVGDSETFNATVLPVDATDKSLSWESSSEEVASVSQTGVVSALSVGTTTITATADSDDTIRASAIITVVDYPEHAVSVTSVSLNKTETTLNLGGSETLSATVLPLEATDKSLIWESSDETVAPVSESGLVTALAVGTATITATSVSDNTKQASVVVTVISNEIAVTGVSLNKESLTMNVGNSETLSAGVYPINATNKAVTWESSDAEVASVNEEGKVEALAVGSATITILAVSDNTKKASATINVTEEDVPVIGVTVNKKELVLDVGDSETLNAVVLPNYATNKALNWQSSNEEVATVSEVGLVSALSFGSAKITVLTVDGEFKEFVYVTVRSASESGETAYQKALSWSASFLSLTREGCETSDSELLSAAWNESQSAYNALEIEVQEIIKETPTGYTEGDSISHAKARYRIILNQYKLNDFMENPIASNQELANDSTPYYLVFIVFGVMLAFVISGIVIYKSKKVKIA